MIFAKRFSLLLIFVGVVEMLFGFLVGKIYSQGEAIIFIAIMAFSMLIGLMFVSVGIMIDLMVKMNVYIKFSIEPKIFTKGE